MAASSGDFICSVCDLRFPFKSKLDRHMQSKDHVMFVESQLLLQDGGNDMYEDVEDAPLQHEDTPLQHEDAPLQHEDEDEEDINEELEFDVEELLEELIEHDTSDNFMPFPSKAFALLFFMLHSPRPFGDTSLNFVRFSMVQCGAVVPSISSLKQFKLPGFTPPIKCVTASGSPFYMIKVSTIIEKCIGNPKLSNMLHRYPVCVSSTGTYREMFHATLWHTDQRFLSPMVCLPNGEQVYIHDCVRCWHPQFGWCNAIVVKIFVLETTNELMADVQILLNLEQYKQVVPETLACFIPSGTWIMFEATSIPISNIMGVSLKPLSLLRWDGEARTLVQVCEEEYSSYLKPHPLKEMAAGKPVVMFPLIAFSDDTSGNKSKKWHKFDSWSIIPAALPRHETSKIPNIHFCCCSDTVSAVGMSEAIVQELILLENEGITVYDAFLESNVLVVAPLMCLIGDNPRASELMNHLGGAARKYCRMCMVDRDGDPTIVGDNRTLVSSLGQMDEIESQTTERSKALLRTKYGIKEAPNPMLSLPGDVFRSTPVESLHTILLGPYKYLLQSTIPKLSPRQKEEVLARIRAFDCSGFRVKMLGNVIRHHQSFVGRDYKGWAQMALFIIYPYLTEGDKKVWLYLTKVFKIAYCNFFDQSKSEEWNSICKGFVDALKEHKPAMLMKQKVHLLLHLVECMKLFGPTSSFNSERCETFNSYIRAKNIFGNKSAPSCDIAHRFAVLEEMRYICDGGRLPSGQCCGDGLRALFATPSVQHFINSVPMREAYLWKEIYQPGVLRKATVSAAVQLSEVFLNIHPEGLKVPISSLPIQQPPFTVHIEHLQVDDWVKEFRGVISSDGELVNCGDSVQLLTHCHQMLYGIFLVSFRSMDGRSVCVLRGFESITTPGGEVLTNPIECPLLLLTHVVLMVKPSEIARTVSVAHECGSGCEFTVMQTQRRVERDSIPQQKLEYKHDTSNLLYCLNIYCV